MPDEGEASEDREARSGPAAAAPIADGGGGASEAGGGTDEGAPAAPALRAAAAESSAPAESLPPPGDGDDGPAPSGEGEEGGGEGGGDPSSSPPAGEEPSFVFGGEGTEDPAPVGGGGGGAGSAEEPAPVEDEGMTSTVAVPASQAASIAPRPTSAVASAGAPDASPNAPLPLDWTALGCDEPPIPIRHPWDVADLHPSDSTDLDVTIVGTHGHKITRMGPDLSQRVHPDLERLVLRSHLIRTMEGVAGLKLELLELYDNMVDELRELDGKAAGKAAKKAGGRGEAEREAEREGEDENDEEEDDGSDYPGKSLRVLDVSYNAVRDMRPNKIKSVRGLRHLKLLRKVDLGANRIRVMEEEELSGLTNLEELWLGKNKITKIQGLGNLTKLRKLDVQANRLTGVEGLEAQVDTLEELYLSHNGIDVEGAKRDTGLALPFRELNTLDLSRNRLTDASPFGHLTSLADLWISGNDIKTFEDVEPLRNLTELDAVYLEYNPVASEFEYRKRLAETIPSLTQIDATMIGGLGQHGYASAGGSGASLVDRMRQMQEKAIEKAKMEEKALVAGGGDSPAASGGGPSEAETEEGEGGEKSSEKTGEEATTETGNDEGT
ncbi:hypothetical protein ACHAWF_018627 [Thalassiosira exigua]